MKTTRILHCLSSYDFSQKGALIYFNAELVPSSYNNYKADMEAEAQYIKEALRSKVSLTEAVNKARMIIRGIARDSIKNAHGDVNLIVDINGAVQQVEKEITLNMNLYRQIEKLALTEATLDTHKRNFEDTYKNAPIDIEEIAQLQKNATVLEKEIALWSSKTIQDPEFDTQKNELIKNLTRAAQEFRDKAEIVKTRYKSIVKEGTITAIALEKLKNKPEQVTYTELSALESMNGIFTDALTKVKHFAPDDSDFIKYLTEKSGEIKAALGILSPNMRKFKTDLDGYYGKAQASRNDVAHMNSHSLDSFSKLEQDRQLLVDGLYNLKHDLDFPTGLFVARQEVVNQLEDAISLLQRKLDSIKIYFINGPELLNKTLIKAPHELSQDDVQTLHQQRTILQREQNRLPPNNDLSEDFNKAIKNHIKKIDHALDAYNAFMGTQNVPEKKSST